jgi:hypothetical protein
VGEVAGQPASRSACRSVCRTAGLLLLRCRPRPACLARWERSRHAPALPCPALPRRSEAQQPFRRQLQDYLVATMGPDNIANSMEGICQVGRAGLGCGRAGVAAKGVQLPSICSSARGVRAGGAGRWLPRSQAPRDW